MPPADQPLDDSVQFFLRASLRGRGHLRQRFGCLQALQQHGAVRHGRVFQLQAFGRLGLDADLAGLDAQQLGDALAQLLGIKPGEVGIKAKTPEGLEPEHTAVAHCTVLLEGLKAPEALAQMAATAEAGSEEELNAVVEGLIGGRHDMTALGRKKPFDTDDLT